jgi:hypothetical protein
MEYAIISLILSFTVGLGRQITVFGIDYNSISRAYPISELTGFKVFEDELNGKTIVLEYNSNAACLKARDKQTNENIIVEKHWWLGWKEFHPMTQIWKMDPVQENLKGENMD